MTTPNPKRMLVVSWLRAPKITSGHGDMEKPVRKWCSTNQTLSNPILSARTHCSSVSLITAWSSTTGRCISYARLNRMLYSPHNAGRTRFTAYTGMAYCRRAVRITQRLPLWHVPGWQSTTASPHRVTLLSRRHSRDAPGVVHLAGRVVCAPGGAAYTSVAGGRGTGRRPAWGTTREYG